MGLIIGGASASDLILDGRSVSLYVGGNPPTKVWPTRETVQITLGPGFQARDEFRAALTARGLDYETITEVPFDIELVGSGNAQHLFYGCSALTSIPPFDMSQVTNANGMFQNCSSLVTVPPLDTSNVWNAPSMFAYCRSLTSVPTMDTSKMTNVTHIFTGCTSLTSVPPMDTSSVTNMRNMFYACVSLTSVPPMDTGSVTDMTNMFYGCTRLTQVPDLDTSQVTNMNQMFFNCSALTSVPDMDTSQVTDMGFMFRGCSSLTYVPDMETSSVTSVRFMFYLCAALTDGNVLLIGRHPQVDTENMILNSGLTREPWNIVPPRTVTIRAGGIGASFEDSSTGDVSLIDRWLRTSGEIGASFVAPVTCNRDVRNLSNFSTIRAGGTIPAGQGVSPTYGSKEPPYVFTEVL